MSYAEVAATGPSQTAEESWTNRLITLSRAPPVTEVEISELMESASGSAPSLIDVDSPHISSVPSDFSSQYIQTDTQASRIQRESDAAERRFEAIERSAKDQAKKAETKAKKAAHIANENSGNPVVLGNGVVLIALAGVLGVGAYRKHVAGELSWKVAGLWAGALSAFAVADIFLSRHFLKKYPTKK